MYRLVICDFDGTLYAYDNKIHAPIRRVMKAVADRGLKITVCTGRAFQAVQPFSDYIYVNAPLLLCNGSLIVDSTREILFAQPTPVELAIDLFRLAEAEDLTIYASLDDLETQLTHHAGDAGLVVRSSQGVAHPVEDPASILVNPPHKVAFITPNPADTERVATIVRNYTGDRANVVVSSPTIIEVIVPGMSKDRALCWLADYLGVKPEETIAIGDGDNDVPMLQWAGLGIAMGNATPKVLSVADWVAPSVFDDGVVAALHKFVLDAD